MAKVLLISILASLGAAAVAWGLFLESFGEKPEYCDIKDFRSSERKSHCGQKWVFWGVIAEMILGFGVAIWEGNEMIKSAGHLAQLEAKAADRHISEQQRKDFIAFLDGSPRGPLMTGSRRPNSETERYADEIFSMLADAGFTIESKMDYSRNDAQFPSGSSVGIFVNNAHDCPFFTDNLINAFRHIGLNPTTFTNNPSRMPTPEEGIGKPNKLLILVVEKN